MRKNNSSRRSFLKGLGAAAFTLSVAPSWALQPTKRWRVGLIGTGWYGKSDLFRLMQVASVDVVALCDPDRNELEKAGRLVKARTGKSESVERSFTLKYLLGMETIPVPVQRRKWNNYIEVIGARENNLKGINVKFPLNVMTVVTGVSGSGKSSLVRSVFYSALKKYYGGVSDRTGKFGALKGSMMLAKDVEFVDQNPIGRSSRSNPVTYIKAWDEVRKLFSDQQLSKQMGYTASYFSFNKALFLTEMLVISSMEQTPLE